MKKKLLLVVFYCGVFSFTCVSQANLKEVGTATLDVEQVFNRSVIDYKNQNKTIQCVDTLRYPLVKQQLLGPNGNSGFSTFSLWQADNESVSHMFYGYTGTQINGVEILGYRSTSSPAATAVVRASVYNVDGSNTPTGTALGSGTVTITSTTQNFYTINFAAPVSVTGNYAVVLDVTNTGGIYTSFYNNAGTGQIIDENLARFKSNDPSYGSNGNWIPMTSIIGLGQVVDFEPIVAPLVSYQINTTGTVAPTTACLGTPVTLTNTTTTPQLADRMYNYSKFRQHFAFTPNDSTYVWDVDNDANPATTPPTDLIWSGNTTHTYANVGTFSPELISLGGFWNSCMDYQTHTVMINPVDDASFSYASSTICEGSVNIIPASVTTTGGTFSSTTGLVFADVSTGEIDIAGSILGTHVVTYTTAGTCPGISTQNIEIISASDASFTYATTEYCTSGTNPSPVITGTAGVFSSTTGLLIDASTGEIDLASSDVGTYTVTNTIAATGSCPAAVETFDIEIVQGDDASFSYAETSYCAIGTASPVITGTSGTFSSTTGLVIDASTGEIDLANSDTGTYTVTNTIAATGSCPAAVETFDIEITEEGDASFSYAATTYCATGTVSPVITGAAGVFSSTTGLEIDASTGEIDLAISDAGTYTVTNTIAASGSCPAAVETFDVTVEENPTATLSLTGNTLSVAETGTYQWINCADNSPIAGETAQTYTPSVNGSYAVIVTVGSCSTTSACEVAGGLGVDPKSIDLLSVYPNPTENTITVGGLTSSNALISVLDVNGRVLITEKTYSSKLELSVRDFEAGVYFIKVESETMSGTKKFVKK